MVALELLWRQGRRPRHYAMEIAQISGKANRAKALEQAPEEWRALIREHVLDMAARKKAKVRRFRKMG